MRFHMLQNVQMALDFLRYKKIKLVNIRAEDIVDGNPKLTLGLIWTIILHFQVSEYPASAALSPTIIVDYDAFTNDTPSSPITDNNISTPGSPFRAAILPKEERPSRSICVQIIYRVSPSSNCDTDRERFRFLSRNRIAFAQGEKNDALVFHAPGERGGRKEEREP